MNRRIPWVLVVLAAMSVFGLRGGGVSAIASGMSPGSIDVNGEERRYELFVPASAPADGAPLVLVLHGGEGNARKIARQTGFNRVAERHGFVVAYPQSREHWNDGRSTTRQFGDDVGFMRTLIETLARGHGIDTQRVYATGASNGGMMTLRLACEAADVIAAFAPVAASFPVPYRPECAPSRPVPLMMINGTEDVLIRWGGGTIRKGRRAGVGGQVIPVRETVAFWQHQNECGNEPQIRELPDSAEDDTRVQREDYAECATGGDLSFLRVEGGGHTWPGSSVVPRGRLAGRVSQDIDASELIWQFFEQHRLPGGDG